MYIDVALMCCFMREEFYIVEKRKVVNVLFLYSIQGKSAEMGACVKMLDL